MRCDVYGERFLPGDLVGFSGADAISDVVNLATWGIPRWGLSHVAIVAATRDAQDRLLLWESTTQCELPCVLQCREVAGVQAHRMVDRVNDYHGRVWHYPIARPLKRTESRRLAVWLEDQIGKGYDHLGAFDARDTLIGRLIRPFLRPDLRTIYCSELTAAALACLGIFPELPCGWSPNRLVRRLLADDILLEPRRLK